MKKKKSLEDRLVFALGFLVSLMNEVIREAKTKFRPRLADSAAAVRENRLPCLLTPSGAVFLTGSRGENVSRGWVA